MSARDVDVGNTLRVAFLVLALISLSIAYLFDAGCGG